MTEDFSPSNTRQHAQAKRPATRVIALTLGLVPLGLLSVAGMLEPSSSGLGTHQQLGLPPCTMRMVLGIRCPGCGITTSWSHFMHGQWRQSMSTNAGGFLLAIYSIAFAANCLPVVMTGRLPKLETQRLMGIGLLATALVVLANWGWRMIG